MRTPHPSRLCKSALRWRRVSGCRGSQRRSCTPSAGRPPPGHQPASFVWPVLTPINPGKHAEQVVPGVRNETSRPSIVSGSTTYEIADDRRVASPPARARRQSRALETWSGASNPSARAEMRVVQTEAHARGARFIQATKRLRSPCDAAAASASAALFALWDQGAPASRSPTVTRSPGERAGYETRRLAAASLLTVTTSVGFRCFRATSTVISFVMLAIGIEWCALCDASTSPVAAFDHEERAPPSGLGTAARAEPANPSATTVYEHQPAHAAQGYFHAELLPDLQRIRAKRPGFQLLDLSKLAHRSSRRSSRNVSPAPTV